MYYAVMSLPSCQIRRRGEDFRVAVIEATLSELIDPQVEKVTMDGIAARAGTGKSALYRRWANVNELIVEALSTAFDRADAPFEQSLGSLRADLLLHFRQLSESLNTEFGLLVRHLISKSYLNPELLNVLRSTYGIKREAGMIEFFSAAMHRGEIAQQAVDPVVLMVAPSMIFHQFVLTGVAPTASEVEHIVDTLVLPLIKPSVLAHI